MPPPPNLQFPRPTCVYDIKALMNITNLSVERCKYLLQQVQQIKHADWREALGYHFAITGERPKLSNETLETGWCLLYAKGYARAIRAHERKFDEADL